MKVLVIGAHGKVGQRLVKALAEQGYEVRAMIRDLSQSSQFRGPGVEAFHADLEQDFSNAFEHIDHVVFTAGSGGHTGPEKTIDIDQNAAIRAVDLSLSHRVKRFIMISAQGARNPEVPSKIQHYYKAKRIADDYLIDSGQAYTIFRPGRLTEDAGNGKVIAGKFIEQRGETSRANLAKAIVISLRLENTRNKIIEILEGSEPVEETLSKI